MKTITIRIPEDDLESIDEEAGEHDATRSEYVRTLIERGRGYEDLQRERDRLDRELAQLLDQREEHTELVRYVEEERSWREQSLGTRLRWWLLGKGD